MARIATDYVLVAHRPYGGILAQPVRDFAHALDTWRRLADVFAPGLVAQVQWWIATDTDAIAAGTWALDVEHGPFRART